MTGELLSPLSLLLSPVGAACPDLAALRSPSVRAADPRALADRLSGLWFEAAYTDVAQVGASCQTLNSTTTDAAGGLAVDFAVRYGAVPFALTELYAPASPNATGVYVKRAALPGGRLLKLPTVVVESGESSAGLVLYSCLEVLGQHVTELIVASRTRTPPAGWVDAALATAARRGVPFDASGVHRVSHDGCQHLEQEEQESAGVAVAPLVPRATATAVQL